MNAHGAPGPCVRCGRAPRLPELFVCVACYADPARGREQRAVQYDRRGEPQPYELQRRELIRRYHWAGGWPRDPRDYVRSEQVRVRV